MGGTHLSSFPIFIAAVGLFFMNMLSWAVYVSDYSRYLPKNVSAPRTYWAVFSGNALATCLYGGLGIYITAISPAASAVASIGAIAGKWILPILALSLLGSDALNAYTGMLAVESVRSTFQKVVASRTARVAGLLLVFIIATVLAETGYKTFLTSFENFIDVLLFFFVPWSVINLIDFSIVKKGRYDVRSFFTPHGVYGGWRWVAILPYLIALAAQVPFLDQTLYVGPMVKVLGGADISWIVGFVVAGAGYLIASRVARGAGAQSVQRAVASSVLTRDRVSLKFGSDVSSRASSGDSQRSCAPGFSGLAASGSSVARTNRRSACWCAGSVADAGTFTTATCLSSASGHGCRSVSPVSSAPSRSATSSGSHSPGSPCPPTCSQACWRLCQRSSTRRVAGCTITADPVTCSGSERSHGSAAATASARTRSVSAVSVSPCGRYRPSRSSRGALAAGMARHHSGARSGRGTSG